MITADTITEEQIEQLRGPAAESGEGYVNAAGEYVPTALVLEWCDEALDEDGSSARARRNARQQLSEILNARGAR